MNDHDAADPGLPDHVRRHLDDEATWTPAPTGALDGILAGIAAESAGRVGTESTPATVSDATGRSDAEVIDLAARRRRRIMPFVAGIAAGLLLFAVISNVGTLGDDDGEEIASAMGSGEIVQTLALGGTDLAPAAAATAEVWATPLGTRIVLDVSGLPPAEPGTYYEAWLRGDGGAVSAGTFHMRGGDGDIELWAGVDLDDFPAFGITIQEIGQNEPSGVAVLRPG